MELNHVTTRLGWDEQHGTIEEMMIGGKFILGDNACNLL
jgi:hypothetical protein